MALRVILASASPRRKEILEHLGLTFEIVTADVDESSPETNPEVLVEELSRRKAEAVRQRLQEAGEWDDSTLILASDTVVAAGEILGKPKDESDARRMLRMLAGSRHRVVSGLALVTADQCVTSHEVTEVEFATMTEEEIAFYVRSGEPFGKAGAYAVQGLASIWIRGLAGDYFNVVGLPVHRLFRVLKEEFGLVLQSDGTLGNLPS